MIDVKALMSVKVIGLDPGTKTGIAQWRTSSRTLLSVESMQLHQAFEAVESGVRDCMPNEAALVIFEDARLRRWFGHSGKEKHQGVGSIKRDCTIWQEFLTDKGIPYLMRKPQAGTTKWAQHTFTAYTGWTKKTNEHARDAALLIYGIEVMAAKTWLQVALQDAAQRTKN